MLKPALARGELQCVGASTLNEYRKYIEKDGALERRFQTVVVEPPTVDETVEILKGLRKKYEDHHRVMIPDETLTAAAQLSERYITDRFLPDKAIDVIDEAGARARLASRRRREVAALKGDLEKVNWTRKRPFATRTSSAPPPSATRSATSRTRSGSSRRSGSGTARPGGPPSTRRRSPSSCRGGPAFPSPGFRRPRPPACSGWRTRSTARWWGRTRPSGRVPRHPAEPRGAQGPEPADGSFIFSGPTGVGKTELARALAKFLFGDPRP